MPPDIHHQYRGTTGNHYPHLRLPISIFVNGLPKTNLNPICALRYSSLFMIFIIVHDIHHCSWSTKLQLSLLSVPHDLHYRLWSMVPTGNRYPHLCLLLFIFVNGSLRATFTTASASCSSFSLMVLYGQPLPLLCFLMSVIVNGPPQANLSRPCAS